MQQEQHETFVEEDSFDVVAAQDSQILDADTSFARAAHSSAWAIPDEARRLAAGGISGIAEVITTHPIDLVKTRVQQAYELGRPAGPAPVIREAIARGGPMELYAGFVPRLLGVVPMRVTFWGTQSITKHRLDEAFPHVHQLARVLATGAIAGTAQTVIDAPIEAMKIRAMTSGRSVSLWEVLRGGRLPGFAPTMARNIVFAGAFATGLYLGADDSALDQAMVRGAASGLLASIVSQPLDFVKTIAQMEGGRSQPILRVLTQTKMETLMSGWMPRAALGMVSMSVGAVVFRAVENFLISGALFTKCQDTALSHPASARTAQASLNHRRTLEARRRADAAAKEFQNEWGDPTDRGQGGRDGDRGGRL